MVALKVVTIRKKNTYIVLFSLYESLLCSSSLYFLSFIVPYFHSCIFLLSLLFSLSVKLYNHETMEISGIPSPLLKSDVNREEIGGVFAYKNS